MTAATVMDSPVFSKWTKRGQLITTPTGQAWAYSHAMLPTVETLAGGRLTLLYSPRDNQGRGYIARAHIEIASDGTLALAAHDPDPVLTPGSLGAFDDSGTTAACVVKRGDDTLLFYGGWTRGVSVPFYQYAGLAIRRHGERDFKRVSLAPLLERTAVDPYFAGTPWVIEDEGVWRMWYSSCVRWEKIGGKSCHFYHVRYAESTDGVEWKREGRVAIDFSDPSEVALSRPYVVRDDSCYRMWFCVRGECYRLGYAESQDGLLWDRDDSRAGLEPSPGEWDSETAYPCIFDYAGVRYLLYSGNGYGQSGIGYATCALAS
jgi:hypothetical protein